MFKTRSSYALIATSYLAALPTPLQAGDIVDDFVLIQDTNQPDPALVLKGGTNGVGGEFDQEWSIELNRNGAGDFSIVDNFDDATNDANTVFQIEPGATGNSLVINQDGSVGLGLDGSSIFTKLALGPDANDNSEISFSNSAANYFLGSDLNGFKLVDVLPFDPDPDILCANCTVPFFLNHGAPTGTFFGNSIGQVGIQTFAPGGPLGSNLSVGNAGAGLVPSSIFFDNGDGWSFGATSSFGAFIAQDLTAYFLINPGGNVGISPGGAGPEAKLHVGGNGDAQVLVRDLSESAGARTLFQLENKGPVKFGFTNSNTSDFWAFNAADNGQLRIAHSGPVSTPGTEFTVFSTGNVTIGGVLTENSDVNAKEDFEEVDSELILSKVMSLPVSVWSYKDDPRVRHMGPMAQDFHASFGLGKTDKGISSLDTSGVALAAIKALKEEKDTEIAARNNEILELKARLESKSKEILKQGDRILQLELAVMELLRSNDKDKKLAAVER